MIEFAVVNDAHQAVSSLWLDVGILITRFRVVL